LPGWSACWSSENEYLQPTGEQFGIEETGIGWVVDDARIKQEYGAEQRELLELAREIAD
jgi:hypothetical protein